jgi:phosphoserine phosphatase
MNPASHCAAFFDLDGTLLAPPSLEQRFIRYLLRRGELGPMNCWRWFSEFLLRLGIDRIEATEGNKKYLQQLPTTLADDWAASGVSDSLPFFTEGLRQLKWHAAQGHRIFLLSGSLAPLVRAIASRLPAPPQSITVCATELESCAGRWTGCIRGELISGAAKAHVAMRLAKQFGVHLAGSFAYADRFSDAAILGLVGFPVAVNPSRGLQRHAIQRRWPIVEWDQQVSPSHTASPEFFPRMESIPQFQVKR